jgi:dipeptide/tripeptide permease
MKAEKYYRRRIVELAKTDTIKKINKVVNIDNEVRIMKEYTRKRLLNALYLVLAAVLFWAVIASIIQRFKCPKKTETELLIALPRNVIGSWDNCR